MRKFWITVGLICFFGTLAVSGYMLPILGNSTKDPQFKELIIEKRGTFILYTGPGQLIWVSKEEGKKK